MKKELIFKMHSPYRDDFRIQAFSFGEGKKSIAIVGPMRGDEVQQQYIVSQLVRRLNDLEAEGSISKGHEIKVIPSVNPYSMNIEKRFWAMDNTDINRMFPGYDKGETTQRIASALFQTIEGYEYGIQLASFYMPGSFIPHVRMLKTGYEAIEESKWFGLQYASIHKPAPFDTTLLNYNWQIWNTKAFSIYGGETHQMANKSSLLTINSILRFMIHAGIINNVHVGTGYNTILVDEDSELASVKAHAGGIFYMYNNVSDQVNRGEVLANIVDPYRGTVIEEIISPVDGEIFFAHDKPLVLQGTPLYKIRVY